jgi:hypothetical protein
METLVDCFDSKKRTPLHYVMLHKKVWNEMNAEFDKTHPDAENIVSEMVARRRRSSIVDRFSARAARRFSATAKKWKVEREVAITLEEQEESCSCLRLLLQAGADINHKTEQLDTVLHYACSASNVKACALLLANGAAISADSNSRSPLHISAWAGSAGCIEGTHTQS